MTELSTLNVLPFWCFLQFLKLFLKYNHNNFLYTPTTISIYKKYSLLNCRYHQCVLLLLEKKIGDSNDDDGDDHHDVAI